MTSTQFHEDHQLSQPHLVDLPGIKLLEDAVTEGRADLLKQWLALGVDVNHPRLTMLPEPFSFFPYGTGLLSYAMGHGSAPRIELVRMLLDAGLDVNLHIAKSGHNPLMECIEARKRPIGDLRLAEMILDAGCDVNAQADNGRTAAHCAASRGDVAMLAMLAKRGAKLNLRTTTYRVTVLHSAIGHPPACQWLAQQTPSLMNAKNKQGATPLIAAILTGELESVKVLMTCGANTRITYKTDQHTTHTGALALSRYLGRTEISTWIANFEAAKAARTTIDNILRNARSDLNGGPS